MSAIKFTKVVGSGNDFILVDNRDGVVSDASGFAKSVCPRKLAVGADGVLLLERSKSCDFKMRIINADGSEAEMCGNGARCIALYAAAKKIAPEKMEIETLAGKLNAEARPDGISTGTVRLRMSDPGGMRLNLELDIGGKLHECHFVDSGVPHAVVFVADLENVDVKGLGRIIRHHAEFAPAGTNADFVKVTGKQEISLRTYERGVEDETLACGTGAVASSVIAAALKTTPSPVSVRTRGGDVLQVCFVQDGRDFKDVYLEGKAKIVYEGTLPGL